MALGLGAGAAVALPLNAAQALPVRPLSKDAWSFGIMSDTQWGANLDGRSPGTIAGGVSDRIFESMIDHNVKFVLQVGDNVDRETDAVNGNPDVRTLPLKPGTVQALTDAGIGFFTVRGNHESTQQAAIEMQELFPQHQGKGGVLNGAHNFSSPFESLRGLSYSFDMDNLRVIVMDQFKRTDGTGLAARNTLDQLDWVEDRVKNRPEGMHCLFFSHKQLIGQNHQDTLFGTPGQNPDAYNRFISILDEGGVRYTISGHDHVHNRSIITSPDGNSQVMQLIAGSDSAKFYTPRIPSNADTFNGPTETMLAQELWTVTHYIVTVDGPFLYIDFYSMSTDKDYGPTYMTMPPTGEWFWREQWGYSLNGEEFLITQGEAYTIIKDSFGSTQMEIIDGVNTSTSTDYAGRPMHKYVCTGWEAAGKGDDSDRVSLWGIADNLQLNDPELTGHLPNADKTDESDVFVIQMNGTPRGFRANGSFGLATRNADGDWVNAVDMNFGGVKRFVRGAYRKGYELGTYGVDPRTKQAWAVVNHGGTFVVRRGI